MGFVDKMKEMPIANGIELDEDGNAKDSPDFKEEVKEEEKEEEVEAEAEEAEEIEASEYEESEKDDKKDKVSAYQKRKVKEYEAKAAEAERRMKEAEDRARRMEELALKNSPSVISAVKEEAKTDVPDPVKDPEGYVKYKLEMGEKAIKRIEEFEKRQQMNSQWQAAQAELEAMENNSDIEDYKDVLKWAEDAEVKKAKRLAPNMSEAQVRAAFKQDKLKAAIEFVKMGKNPVAELHELMIESYGYQKKETESVKKDDVKNFDAVKKNKAKAVTPLAAGGRSGSQDSYTPDNARSMSLKQFAKLSKAEKDKIFAGQ